MPEASFHAALAAIPQDEWDALRPDGNPFLAHAFLAGLEQLGCIEDDGGWLPHHVTLHEGGRLVAAAPLYLKAHSHGEFIYDWGWAEAHARRGLPYYPKLFCGTPWSPVPAPRLLVGATAEAGRLRLALVDAMQQEASRLGLSSAHVAFATDADAAALTARHWLARDDWQFHWHNRGWRDFDDFLGALDHKRRKEIHRERRRVAEAGVSCETLPAASLSTADWQDLHDFYAGTFADKGNLASLNLGFFRHLGSALPAQVLAVLCRREGRNIAGALLLRDARTLYGRYWGAREQVDGLHFEACYYQGIDYCLREGLATYQPGAGGLHKFRRGFEPTRTQSFHWIADPRLGAAIASALAREAALRGPRDAEFAAHSPYARPA